MQALMSFKCEKQGILLASDETCNKRRALAAQEKPAPEYYMCMDCSGPVALTSPVEVSASGPATPEPIKCNVCKKSFTPGEVKPNGQLYRTCPGCRNKKRNLPQMPTEAKASRDVGTKYDQDKLRYDLVPPEMIESLAQLFTHGAHKYDDDNWLKVAEHRYYAALMRHIIAHQKGEILDPDSGMPHMAHAFWNAGVIMHKTLASMKNSQPK